METVLGNISLSFNRMVGWELVAVILAIAYLLLIMRENIWGWLCALLSTAIYTLLFWEVNLPMDSALNIYYMGMAVYGWRQWHLGSDKNRAAPIVKWRPGLHGLGVSAILLATGISGYLLSEHTRAAWPYLDSFTTWASVFTTYMVVKKVLQNWIYWIVIDAVALCLYIDRALYLTALLFFAYLIICIFGYIGWKKNLIAYEQSAARAPVKAA